MHCSLESILETLRQKKQTLALGTNLSSKAFILARAFFELKKNLLVLCPDQDAAHDLYLNLDVFCRKTTPSESVLEHFPTWDMSPYSSISSSIKTRLKRIRVLSSIVDNPEPKIIVTTIDAVFQSTIPKDLFLKYSLLLSASNKTPLSQPELISHLLQIGYSRVDTVEDCGTFSLKGNLLDAFVPQYDYPARVEFCGNEVEKIRFFEPSTQRTLQNSLINSIVVTPAREVLINNQTKSILRERIKTHADESEIPRKIRDPVLLSIQDEIYSDHTDAWAPFAYEKPARFWDYLPEDLYIVWDEHEQCIVAWEGFRAEQKTLETEAKNQGLILPDVSSLYGRPDELSLSKTILCFEKLEVLNSDFYSNTTQHCVSIQTNLDLTRREKYSFSEQENTIRGWLKEGFKILIVSSTQTQLERVCFLLKERSLVYQIGDVRDARANTITLVSGYLAEGFRWLSEGIILLTENELLGSRTHKKKSSKRSSARDWTGLQTLTDLSSQDLVVHVDHGIGRYHGLVRLDLLGAPTDFLLIEYAQKDKLFLPIYRLNLIQKYFSASSASGDAVHLDRLGSARFAKTKEKVKEAVKKLAVDLVKLYAERTIRPGIVYAKHHAELSEFEAKFPFEETPDQSKTIESIQTDLESGKIMDRLVCGDVGFGKTEVAMRAAFRVVSEGKQVAVLVPTTILAQQHELSFKTRFKEYPFYIESISRFKSQKEQKDIIEKLARAQIDIIIGTHRLLSRDILFKDLGLVIVDEEHRFGVEHKEKLKTIKLATHVLTLTATPIPRTLHMALAGLREVSIMNTPPVDRLPIRTYISKYDENIIKQAIERELNRGGQVFFVHNRVQNIQEQAQEIKKLVHTAKIGIAHGQMAEKKLEETMLEFYQKRTNVLVCTSIIESGLDLPSANTIIINRADTFGLAQLYQIRGRVGRSQFRAFAYLLLPKEGSVTEESKKRLEIIQRFIELGSGFSVATHDLEIRGGGDILGQEQSGHVAAVGLDLYTELLEEAVREIEGKPTPIETLDPEIKVPFPAYLSDEYAPDIHQRLALYRRLSSAADAEEVEKLEEELKDRFGELPEEAKNLLWIIYLKVLLKHIGIAVLVVGKERVSLTPAKQNMINPKKIISLLSQRPSKYQMTPDNSKLVMKASFASLKDLYFSLEGLFKEIT